MPFEVPENWEWTTLENICSKIGSGSTPRGGNYSYEGIPFFRSQNVHNNGLCYDDIKYIDDETHQCMISTEVHPGDVLLNITGGSLGRCAVVPSTFDIGNVSQHVCILRPILVISEYLHAFILSGHFHKNMKVSGSGREGLPKYNLEKMVFPLPPFDEQARIVNQVQNLMYLIDDINANRDLLEKNIYQYKQEVLDLAISGKLNTQLSTDIPALEILKAINPSYSATDNRHYRQLPDSWQVVKIKDVFTINPKNKVDDDIDAGFVSMSMIDDGYRDSYQFEKKKWSLIKGGFTHFQDGDIAVAKISPCLENRKSMILKNLPNGIGAGTTELHVFRSAIVYPKFALYFFKSDYFINHCVGTFNGVVGQQRVGKNIIEDIIFPLPTYEEQKRISEKITHIFECLDKITAEL